MTDARKAGLSPLLPDGSIVTVGARVPAAPAVSVIVLVLDDPSRCLALLDEIARRQAAGAPPAEVLVVANGTPPAARDALERRDDIVLLRSRVNHGFSGGCNWASRFARAPLLLLLNDDAMPRPGWLEALVAAAEAHPEAGAIGSRLLFEDGTLQEAGVVLWSDGTTTGVGRGEPGDAWSEPRVVDYCSACSLLVRRDAWDGAGGMDEAYIPAYYEDADLALTLQAAGWTIRCEPASAVVHGEGASTAPPFRAFLSWRNGTRFRSRWARELARRPPRPTPGDVRPPEAVIRAAAEAVAGRPASPAPRRARTSPPAPHVVTIEETLRLEIEHALALVEVTRAFADHVVPLAQEVPVLRDRLAQPPTLRAWARGNRAVRAGVRALRAARRRLRRRN